MSSASSASYVRRACRAGTWYEADADVLSAQLDRWLNAVPNPFPNHGPIPESHARLIIAPHAGYEYSGYVAAYAYQALDLSQAKRVFLLGPSHTRALDKCAVSQCTRYETPLGGIEIDTATTAELYHSKEFDLLPLATDNAEHSLEMHLPYLYKVFSRHFATPADHPRLVPILVGNTDAAAEQRYGRLLAPYLADPTSIFVISSDFCHWGARFGYTYYLPTAETLLDAGIQLRSNTQLVAKTEIHQSIGRLDDDIMHAIAGGMHTTYLHQLGLTGNTVCGRHPIGIALCALGELRRDFRLNGSLSNFHFLKYARSSEPSSVHDSSVSYASAVAVVKCSDVLADLEIMDDESDEMAEDAGTLVTLAS